MRSTTAVIAVIALSLGGCSVIVPQPTPPLPTAPVEQTSIPDPTTVEIPSAVDYLESRLAEFDHSLYVYRDFVDGANHYTQKAWIGDSLLNIPSMREDARGWKDTSGIEAEIDFSQHSWGGYMFVNGTLAAGDSVPSLNFGTTDAALDLRGATSLSFYARSESGQAVVEFFMGGLGVDEFSVAPFPDSVRVSTGQVRLTPQWQEFTIPLNTADLSRIGCGFGWVSRAVFNNVDKIRFSIDDIKYHFDLARLEPLFLTSYAPAVPGSDQAIINNFAYLYDNAATAMALSQAGKHERARQIADAIVYAVHHDRYFTDGRLRNAYLNGNPASHPGWYSSRGQEFARLPGFYDGSTREYYEDIYGVSTSTGNCSWAILALLEVYSHAPERKDYLEAARSIADFVLTLQSGDGFTGGYEGWEPDPVKSGYKSTEHNTDLIAAFSRLNQMTGESRYGEASESARRFVLSKYDSSRGVFYTGTTSDGVTLNTDVVPLDAQTWTLSVLQDFPDSASVIDFVEEHMGVGQGYDFEADSKDGIWFEGTAQMGVLYLLRGDEDRATSILNYLNDQRLEDGSITAADRDSVSTGFLVSGTDIPWTYDKRQHLGATAWLSFLQQGYNPFAN